MFTSMFLNEGMLVGERNGCGGRLYNVNSIIVYVDLKLSFMIPIVSNSVIFFLVTLGFSISYPPINHSCT